MLTEFQQSVWNAHITCVHAFLFCQLILALFELNFRLDFHFIAMPVLNSDSISVGV